MKQEIKNKLLELSDEKYKKFHSGLCPGTTNIIGVRVPVLRNYAKELIAQYDIQQLLHNIDDEFYEEVMLQGMLIGLCKENDIDKHIMRIKNFVPKIDNWAVCDTFCAGLKITKNHKEEIWKLINQYCKSQNEFEIRFGVVMLLDYYIEEDYIEKDFEIFNKIEYKGYYVQMAVAWALSICLIKYFDITIEYLKNAKIDTFTYNKALQKGIESYRLTSEQKQLLKDMKK